MKYKGKLYGKCGNKFIELEECSEDIDEMENEIKSLKAKLQASEALRKDIGDQCCELEKKVMELEGKDK